MTTIDRETVGTVSFIDNHHDYLSKIIRRVFLGLTNHWLERRSLEGYVDALATQEQLKYNTKTHMLTLS